MEAGCCHVRWWDVLFSIKRAINDNYSDIQQNNNKSRERGKVSLNRYKIHVNNIYKNRKFIMKNFIRYDMSVKYYWLDWVYLYLILNKKKTEQFSTKQTVQSV